MIFVKSENKTVEAIIIAVMQLPPEPLFLSAPYLLQMSFENGLRTRFSIH